MTVESHQVEWEGGAVTARGYGVGETTVLLAHGAGTDQDHPLLTSLARALEERGVRVVTFNYPYTESGRKAPDRAPVLLACHRAVAGWVRHRFGGRLVLAGRSMGGRMASMLVAEGEPADGLVLYAYPLHPAGKPERLRIEHLSGISVPALFFQGSRDALARGDLFDLHIRPWADVIDLEGTDHSWRTRGRTIDEIVGLVADETVSWIRRLASGPRSQA